tara:strand:+ start:841 stop:1089 length:249 start_codon:yes stop_codon:yes gene_type:complete
MEKVEWKDWDEILDNFDEFCDNFENRATKAYNIGDQNEGRVIEATERAGEDTPVAVREVHHPREQDIPVRESVVDVQATQCE